MRTINAKIVQEKQPGAQEVSLHIEGMPEGGASITAVEVQTLAAGAQATASVEGSTLKLGIPKGDTGSQGPKGDPGDDASITPAAHVDPSSGTVADVVNALVGAGLMASA